jgi:hypothetical protein
MILLFGEKAKGETAPIYLARFRKLGPVRAESGMIYGSGAKSPS